MMTNDSPTLPILVRSASHLPGVPMPEEMFDVVDTNDRVLEQRPRSEVHRQKLLHRAVHVFVFNSRGELLIQLRSATKDEAPLTYTSSASGHVSAGETYEETAPRELREEVGLESPLRFVVKLPASPELAREHSVLYETVCDAPPVPDPIECERVEFVDPDQLEAWIAREPDKFSSPFVTLFRWYRANRQRS